MGWRAPVGVVLILLAGAAPVAIADEMQEPVHLDYRAADGCPDQATFEARVEARTMRARFVPVSGHARTFDVRLQGGWPSTGHLTVSRGGVVEGSRDLEGTSCSEVADAMALAVALAIDPAARMAPSASSTATPAASSAAPIAPPPSATAAAVATSPPLPVPPAASAEEVGADTAPERPLPSAAPPRRAWSFGADFDLATGVSPQTLLGVSPYVGWRAASGARMDPSVRLAFLRAASGTLPVPGGAAAFTWTIGRLDACLGTGSRAALRLLACARVEAGALEASGSEVALPQTRTRPWLAVGPLARVEWSFLEPMFLEAEAAAMAHVTEDRFFFVPDTTVYQVPLLGVGASAGVGVHFL